MDSFKYLFFIAFFGFLSTATAVPVFTHTTDSLGLYTISADGTDEPMDLAGLNVDNIIGTANGNDIGINYSDYFSIVDSDSDGLLEFTFSNTDNLTELTGTAFYSNEEIVAFTYSLTDEIVDPPSSDYPLSPTPNVSEPSTLLLLGAGLIGIGLTHSRKRK